MKIIPGYDRYHINELGQVFNSLGQQLKPGIQSSGYASVGLYVDHCRNPKTMYIHRLMAMTFLNLDISDSNLQVNHLDGDKSNNKLDNLQVCTHSENLVHRSTLYYPNDSFEDKECRTCKVIKPLSNFIKRSNYRTGYGPYCKDCWNQYMRNRRK